MAKVDIEKIWEETTDTLNEMVEKHPFQDQTSLLGFYVSTLLGKYHAALKEAFKEYDIEI